MKLIFKASKKTKQYNGLFSVKDGEVTPDISDIEAKRLLVSWPDNFSELIEALKTQSKKSIKPEKDKMFRGAKDK